MENPWVRMGRGGEINGFIGNKGSMKYMRNEKVEMTIRVKLHARGKIENKVGEEGRVEQVMVGNGFCSEMNEKNDEKNGLGVRND